jgi:HEAT repeat protein
MKKKIYLFYFGLFSAVLFAVFPGQFSWAQEAGSADGETPPVVNEGDAAQGAAMEPSAEGQAAEAQPAGDLPQTETAAAPPAVPVNEKQLNTLHYGTETEIATLIQTLKNEKNSSLDSELMVLVETSKNKSILTGILSFFAEIEKSGIEARAVRIIVERDAEANETVLAAVNYLGRVKSGEALPALEELISSGESRFLNAAIRALGRAGQGGEGADETALYLLDYYNNGNPNNEDQREIIVALGESGSKEAAPFLVDIIKNNEERFILRMAALDAIAKIGDPAGLDAVIEAVSSSDPNVRATAIAALGPFPGEAADNAILEGFRDSYYRTRIGAASAAGKRKLEAAVPYLKFRAENDDVPAAKDEAIKALGAIGSPDAVSILDNLFSERKNSDRVRILAGEMLLQNDPPVFAKKVIVELDDAGTRKQTALYNGFLRILGPVKDSALEALARRFLALGTVIEKSYALDMTLNNEFPGLAESIRPLLDEKKNGASLSRKAQSTMDKLGIE